mmetsp:Transcript_8103/g.14100  ORF Transcript_8103/g.14100 Transcript_8103/m.14100 type:complete len:221 (+) Transcript_8103:147-809(+)
MSRSTWPLLYLAVAPSKHGKPNIQSNAPQQEDHGVRNLGRSFTRAIIACFLLCTRHFIPCSIPHGRGVIILPTRGIRKGPQRKIRLQIQIIRHPRPIEQIGLARYRCIIRHPRGVGAPLRVISMLPREITLRKSNARKIQQLMQRPSFSEAVDSQVGTCGGYFPSDAVAPSEGCRFGIGDPMVNVEQYFHSNVGVSPFVVVFGPFPFAFVAMSCCMMQGM